MAKIILICGKICSGKTFLARELMTNQRAVLLSTDELTYALIDNQQGEFYDEFARRANLYLREKAAEIAQAGADVILDWGFWKAEQRCDITSFFRDRGIPVEWHYVKISDDRWEKNIAKRNAEITAGKGGCAFFVDDGLKNKLLSLWEEPSEDEIDRLNKSAD